MKIFIAGVGSDIGTAIARELENRSAISEIAGVDLYPPRRYLAKTQFHLFKLGNHSEIFKVISDFEPDVIINFGLYEPSSRLDLKDSKIATTNVIEAIEQYLIFKPEVKVISRSSIVVYGFADNSRLYDESSPVNPDTPYGEMCCEIEERIKPLARNLSIIRSAPEIASHVPHPLARVLLQPWIPAQIRLPFTSEASIPITSPRDVVNTFVASTFADTKNRIFHCVSPGNIAVSQAAKIGRRALIFSTGIGFGLMKQISYYAGAPIEEHVEMFIRRGMKVDSTATRMFFDDIAINSSTEILKTLYSSSDNSININSKVST